MDDFEAHKHKTDKLVRDTLRQLAKEAGRTYKEALEYFRNQNEELTIKFWIAIFKKRGDEFNRVDYCPSCRAFHLYKVME